MNRRVVVVGGGFAGLFVVRGLHGSPVDVTVIDRAAHHLFQPLLYQVATGVLSEGQIAVPLRKILEWHRNVDCLLAEVTSVDVVRTLCTQTVRDRVASRFLTTTWSSPPECASPTSGTTSSPSMPRG